MLKTMVWATVVHRCRWSTIGTGFEQLCSTAGWVVTN